MSFVLPRFSPPNFAEARFRELPTVKLEPAPADGVAPTDFHATSNHPEYVHVAPGEWVLARESRMDCVLVVRGSSVEVIEARRLQQGDPVVVGRRENGEDGVLVHASGFAAADGQNGDKFAFRTRGTRETPFSRSYDRLYELLRYERDHGCIVWVLGPAVAFDRDSRNSMVDLIDHGYCQALLAGNALATHDLEAACFGTGLGQDIYSQQLRPMGHYHHLDVLNSVRRAGSVERAIGALGISDGIVLACQRRGVPLVLCGSIRDDGPLPEVIADVYRAQDAMRVHARRATTVVTLATQLHTIAVGNMTPSYHVLGDGTVRPVYFYVVDMSEFSADKLANRGSAQAVAILTNAQDFMINLRNNLVDS